jgi:hypothetical protein
MCGITLQESARWPIIGMDKSTHIGYKGGVKLQMRHFDASRSVGYRAGASTSNQEFSRFSDGAMKKACAQAVLVVSHLELNAA